MANCTGKPNTYNSLMQPEDQAHKIVNHTITLTLKADYMYKKGSYEANQPNVVLKKLVN